MRNHSINTRFLALTMAFSILVSSFGVAKVTHFCRASSHITKSVSCNQESQNHCCSKMSGSKAAANRVPGSCCSKIIKMFRADLETMLNSSLGVPAAFVAIHHDIFKSVPNSFLSSVLLPDISQPDIGLPDKVGRGLLFCSFLI